MTAFRKIEKDGVAIVHLPLLIVWLSKARIVASAPLEMFVSVVFSLVCTFSSIWSSAVERKRQHVSFACSIYYTNSSVV